MTNDNPEQEARAAVVRAVKKASAHADAKDGCSRCEMIAAALDRLCTVVKEPLEAQLGERDERIRKLEEAARAAYAHVIELQDAWIRGVLSEHDGLGGTRSNRNDDVLHLITHALGEG